MLGVKCEVGFGNVEGYKRSKYQSTNPYLSHNGTTGLMVFFYLLSKTGAEY